MHNEQFILSYLPIISKLANKYQNKFHDYEELYSEGQLLLLEYLHKNTSNENLKRRVYAYIKGRLIKLSEENKDVAYILDCKPEDIAVYIDSLPPESHFELHKAMDSLKAQEKDVVSRYYGFLGNKETLRQIGRRYGVTGSYMGMVKRKAEAKIERKIRKSGVKV